MSSDKNYRQERKAQGLCARCGIEKINNERVNCDNCLKKEAKALRKLRKKRKAEGKCSKCNLITVPGKRLCNFHHEDSLQYNRRLSDERRTLKLCEKCGKEKSISNQSRKKGCFCYNCYLKVLAHSHLGSSKLWTELLNLANSQKVCPYTGFDLKIGRNASLDHIIPKFHGGASDPSNFQFVYCDGAFDVNRMKGEMTDEEFREAIKILYANMFKKL